MLLLTRGRVLRGHAAKIDFHARQFVLFHNGTGRFAQVYRDFIFGQQPLSVRAAVSGTGKVDERRLTALVVADRHVVDAHEDIFVR